MVNHLLACNFMVSNLTEMLKASVFIDSYQPYHIVVLFGLGWQ